MKEITEIDMKKYFVLKREDLDRFFSQYTKGIFTTSSEQKKIYTAPFNTVCREIMKDRKANGKKENNYLVLNMDDDIDWKYLTDWHTVVHPDYRKLKVKDIAVPLVNAILKTK